MDEWKPLPAIVAAAGVECAQHVICIPEFRARCVGLDLHQSPEANQIHLCAGTRNSYAEWCSRFTQSAVQLIAVWVQTALDDVTSHGSLCGG